MITFALDASIRLNPWLDRCDLPKDYALQQNAFLELREWSLKRMREIVLEVIPKDYGLVGIKPCVAFCISTLFLERNACLVQICVLDIKFYFHCYLFSLFFILVCKKILMVFIYPLHYLFLFLHNCSILQLSLNHQLFYIN